MTIFIYNYMYLDSAKIRLIKRLQTSTVFPSFIDHTVKGRAVDSDSRLGRDAHFHRVHRVRSTQEGQKGIF